MINARSIDIGKAILRNLIFTDSPQTLTKIISDADARALTRGFTHPTGVRPHRSTIAVHNGRLMERRQYLLWQEATGVWYPLHIEWIPIMPT